MEAIARTFSPLNGLHGVAAWLLRIGFAAVFITKGLEKFTGLGGFAEMMGLPVAVAFLVALAELLGGLAVLVGGFLTGAANDVLTRLGGLATIPVLLGAISRVHWGQWTFVPTDSHPMGGIEYQTILLILALYFVIRGRYLGSAEPLSTGASQQPPGNRR